MKIKYQRYKIKNTYQTLKVSIFNLSFCILIFYFCIFQCGYMLTFLIPVTDFTKYRLPCCHFFPYPDHYFKLN